MLLARPVVTVLLSYGHFDAADVTITAATVAGLAWGIVGFSLYLYVLRGFYALRDTRTPFLINLVENALTLVFAFVFVRGTHSGVQGLAWAWSLAYFCSAGSPSSCCAVGSGLRVRAGRAHDRPGVADGRGHRRHGRGRLPRRPRVRPDRRRRLGGR